LRDIALVRCRAEQAFVCYSLYSAQLFLAHTLENVASNVLLFDIVKYEKTNTCEYAKGLRYTDNTLSALLKRIMCYLGTVNR